MTKIAYIEPLTLVNWMTDPGIPVNDFHVPVKRYMSANVNFGGNAAAEAVLGPLAQMKGADGVRLIKKTRNFGRLMTGQGYFSDFCLVMQFIADNLDQVKTIKAAQKYFKDSGDARSVLGRMVDGKVFGMDCIGFTSQFLVNATIWPEYKPYYPKDYLNEFSRVSKLDEVRPMTFMIWDNVHIAIVNKVHGPPKDGQLMIDVCQSSHSSAKGGASGPQCNERAIVELARTGERPPKFKILAVGTPPMPVVHNCWLANFKLDKLLSAQEAMGFLA